MVFCLTSKQKQSCFPEGRICPTASTGSAEVEASQEFAPARAGRARGDCGTVLSEVVAIFACLSTKHKSEVISFVHAVVDTKIDTCKRPTHNVAADFS